MDSRRDVPEQVLFDILLFLPVISLLRFKTICKSWCSVIESSAFITKHLCHNSEKDNLIVYSYEDRLYMLSGRKYELCSNINFERACVAHSSIVNSCNGILCVAHDVSQEYWRVSLWNPATKQVREVPESSFLCHNGREALLLHSFAIGFDVKTDDYKIVSISLFLDEVLNDCLIQVYCMRADSWRTIHESADFPIMMIDNFIDVACKSEMCLWIGEGFGRYIGIFYFDFTSEAYGTVPLPEDYNGCTHSPAFLNDKIAYIKFKWRVGYEIWVMNEVGIKESWNKIYKLEEPSELCIPDLVNLSKNGDFILCRKDIHCSTEEQRVYLYDIVTGEEKLLDVLNPRSVMYYNESLVSVKRTNDIC